MASHWLLDRLHTAQACGWPGTPHGAAYHIWMPLLDARLRHSKGIKRKHRPVEYDRIGQVIAFPPWHSIVIDFHIGWHFPFQGIHNALKIIIRKGKTVPIPNALDAVIKKMVNHFSSLNPVLSARHHRQVGMQSVDPLPFIEWSGIRNIQRHRVALPDGGMPVAEHDQQRLPVCLQQYGFWPLAEDSPLYLQDNPAENEILSPHPGAVQARGHRWSAAQRPKGMGRIPRRI